MGLQSIIEKTEFISFLDSGAILQVAPDQFKLIWGPFCDVSMDDLSDLVQKTIIYKPDFWDFLNEKGNSGATVSGSREHIVTRLELVSLLTIENHPNDPIQWEVLSTEDFKEQFIWSQEKFKLKVLEKTVPVIQQKGSVIFSKFNLINALKNLIQAEHFGATFGFWNNNAGFLGHSPEIVLEWKATDKILNTMALAGTTAAGNPEVILADPKILKEHQIVVSDLQIVLTEENPSKEIHTEKMNVLQLKHLNHLLTRLWIDKMEFSEVIDNLKKIHPSAALGLFPRSSAMYQEFKKFKIQGTRKNFAAPFGFLNSEYVKIVVAIRGYLFNGDQITVISGCGVTIDSDLNSEITELENKRNSVKKMMGFNL